MANLFVSFFLSFLSLSSLSSGPLEQVLDLSVGAKSSASKEFKNSLPVASVKQISQVPEPIKEKNFSRGVEVTADSVLLLDLASGKILFAKDRERILPIASLTKLMTALVLHDFITDWQKTIVFSIKDRVGGNKTNLYAGDTLTSEEMLFTALIGSDNDAIMSLVRSTGLTIDEFVNKMNEKAALLGLKNTVFADPTGLSPANQSTVNDLANIFKISLAIPKIKKATETSQYTLTLKNRAKTVRNTNQLLSSFLNVAPYEIIGGKTGYIEEAGYNLAVEVRNNNAQVIAIVLGSESNNERFQEVKSLISWAFENYQWPSQSAAPAGSAVAPGPAPAGSVIGAAQPSPATDGL